MPFIIRIRISTWILLVVLFPAGSLRATPPRDGGDTDFFERQVRPLLIRRCGQCHGPDNAENSLTLTTASGIARGGTSGRSVVPGQVDQSLLIQAIRYASERKMPPDRRLPAGEIEVLETWVRQGASLPKTAHRSRPVQTDADDDPPDRNWWAFQPVRRPTPPTVNGSSRVRTPVDSFVLHRLEAQGFSYSSDADRRTLLRRITFDLIGLPPTPEEMDAFLSDSEANAYERVVDRLLRSPHYGERWGRHWLDVVRYADTNGRGMDYVYPNAWRYRDYVVRSFNNDKPYDEFVCEQLAGDLLPAKDDAELREQLTATGLLTLAPKGLTERDKEKMALDVVDDQIDVLGRTLLGLTLSCARCHDHKSDPVSTRDYYALAGIFRSTVSLSETNANPSYWPEKPLERKEVTEARKDYLKRHTEIQKSLAETKASALRELEQTARNRIFEYLFAASRIFRTARELGIAAHWPLDKGLALDPLRADARKRRSAGSDKTPVQPADVTLADSDKGLAPDPLRADARKRRSAGLDNMPAQPADVKLADSNGNSVPATFGPGGQFATQQDDGQKPTVVDGRIKDAVRFAGPQNCIRVQPGRSQCFDFGKAEDFSVSFWFRLPEGDLSTGRHAVISAEYPSSNWQIVVQVNSRCEVMLIQSGGQQSVAITTSANETVRLNDGNWHHVVFACDRDNLGHIWIDGRPAGQNSIRDVSSEADFRSLTEFVIGPSASSFETDLDDVAIWKRLLNGDDVSQLFACGGDTREALNAIQTLHRRSRPAGGADSMVEEPFTYITAVGDSLVPAIVREFAERLERAQHIPQSAFHALSLAEPESVAETKKLLAPTAEKLTKLLDNPLATPIRVTGDATACFPPETQRKLVRLEREARQMEKQKIPEPEYAMIAFDVDQPRDLHVAVGGDHTRPGELVARGFPEVLRLPATDERLTIPSDRSGRRQLADWLTDPRHPLTARVLVNRVWQWHFGNGIVATPDNFGRPGQPPSHPLLLDWLAADFIDNGWSIKHLHRQIVLSTAYRQSSGIQHAMERASETDSENRLLWRMNRRRLEAEAVRDAILAVSGSLDPATGGTTQNWNSRTYLRSDRSAAEPQNRSNRRSLYLPVKRGNSKGDILSVFDFSNPNAVTPKRAITTVPAQALYLMNNPFVIAQAQAFSRRLSAASHVSTRDRIRLAWRLALSRLPSDTELERADQFVSSGPAERTWMLLAQSLFCLNEFVYVD